MFFLILVVLGLIALYDIQNFRIPNYLLFTFLILSWGYLETFNLKTALIWGFGFVLLKFVLEKMLKRPALGWGDVKLILVMGLWVPLDVTPLFLLSIGLLGVAISIFYKIFRHKDIFPFAPALILGFLLTMGFAMSLKGYDAHPVTEPGMKQHTNLGKNKMVQLTGPSLEPVSKTIEKIVILFHGYGASGNDLLSLAVDWQKDMPNTLFLLPNAPTILNMSGGYQWFDLPDVKYQTMQRNIDPVLPIVQNYIDQVSQKYQIQEENIALVGFSQGGMMAIATALIRTRPVAAVLSYSGAFVLPEAYQVNTAVPVLLIHGDLDQVVPLIYQEVSQKALMMRGVSVNTYICKNIAHGINQEGIRIGRDFLWQNLNAPQHKNNPNTQREN